MLCFSIPIYHLLFKQSTSNCNNVPNPEVKTSITTFSTYLLIHSFFFYNKYTPGQWASLMTLRNQKIGKELQSQIEQSFCSSFSRKFLFLRLVQYNQ